MKLWITGFRFTGARALKAFGRETSGLQIHDSKGPYLAQVRRFFEVGENAFALLNRGAGLKQLDSIDDIFRELVLDDRSAFDRAGEVAKEFDDLAAIHAELEIARQQQLFLQPVANGWQLRGQYQNRLAVQHEVQTLLPVCYAEEAHRLLSHRLARLEAELQSGAIRVRALADTLRLQEGQTEALRPVYLQLGGSNVEQLLELIASQQRIRTKELIDATLPGSRLLVVENESSLYQLPRMSDTVAILGAGLNLAWLEAPGVRRQATCLLGRSRHLGIADAGHRTRVSAATARAAHDARHLRFPCGAVGRGGANSRCGESTDGTH